MIAYVKGTVAELTEDNVVIDVGGIGYNIKISSSTAEKMPGIGREIKIYTYTLVREDAFWLYGFLTRDDLDIFKKCITVNGIGPKGALAILSVMDADTLRFAIMSGDAKAISRAPGIGSKTAERLILDLKDKVSLEDSLLSREAVNYQESVNGAIGAAHQEAIEALVALGYGHAEAAKAVRSIPTAEDMDAGALLKAALKNLF
ncbi:MAG: Holliday junction branch migration protein RuvA [Lachnospiraceae bacterium]|nr:Holliday junction branch migration protein RuvA [Lachnospiraceae bacterium]